MTVIDRQKYVAELGKLLSGMAPQDREAVLRGVNARFDEEGDDAAVIASLGSPTFAAVSVLRGYTPPEEGASDSVPMPEPRRTRPEPKPVEPAHRARARRAGGPRRGRAGRAQAESAEADDPPRRARPRGGERGGGRALPSSPSPRRRAPSPPSPLRAGGPPAEPETEPEPEPEQPEIPAEPAEPETAEEPAEAEAPEDASEPAEEPEEPDEPEEPGTEAEGPEEPAESDEAEEPEEAEENPDLPPFWGGPPELPKPPKAKVGLLILYIILGVAVGLPLTVLFACVALGIFGCGGALIAAAALLVSFCFLGMGVVADILLLAGAALVLAALGLLLLFFAVWFFIRCVVGFVNLILRKGREWCYDHGEVDT
ncbi:MAG: hypothetical protein ACLUEK_05805 [Oscillospiraceae bacterium]